MADALLTAAADSRTSDGTYNRQVTRESLAGMTHAELSPTERIRRVAAILAKAVLRYQRRIRRTEGLIAASYPDSASECLEVLGKTRLTVPRRVAG
jgi:hypothetical protein